MVYVASPLLMAKIRSLFPIRNATRVPFHDCTTLHCTVCIHLSRKPNELEWPCTYIYIFIWRRKHSVQLLYLLIGRCPSIIVGLLLLLLVATILPPLPTYLPTYSYMVWLPWKRGVSFIHGFLRCFCFDCLTCTNLCVRMLSWAE